MSELSEQQSDKQNLDQKSSKHYRYLVFIGRFQPFHAGHKAVIDEALKRSDEVIMLIGSANCHVAYAIRLASMSVPQ